MSFNKTGNLFVFGRLIVPYGVFITGTDTGVGKTWVGTSLVNLISRQGVKVRPRKPVESGCIDRDGRVIPRDGEAYYKAVDGIEPLSVICRFQLQAEISPHRAASLEGVRISLQDVIEACRNGVQKSDFLLLEGAGGFCSPMTEKGLNADLAVAMGLPVVLVTADRLGAIHQTISTAECILSRGLELAGIVLNSPTAVLDTRMENAVFLSRWLGVEVITVSHSPLGKSSRWGENAPDLVGLADRLALAPKRSAF